MPLLPLAEPRSLCVALLAWLRVNSALPISVKWKPSGDDGPRILESLPFEWAMAMRLAVALLPSADDVHSLLVTELWAFLVDPAYPADAVAAAVDTFGTSTHGSEHEGAGADARAEGRGIGLGVIGSRQGWGHGFSCKQAK